MENFTINQQQLPTITTENPPITSNKKYDVFSIVSKCESLDTKEALCAYVGEIIEEKRTDFLTGIYNMKGKEFLVKMLEKTLKIMNEGGMLKKKLVDESDPENALNFRTVGGTFINVVKETGEFSKDVYKRMFYRNYASRNKRRKLYKKLDKLSLN